jgi:cytochrome o ubiquinol oxidase subunit 1
MFGKLDLSAIPLSQPIPLVTSAIVIVIAVGVLIAAAFAFDRW